MEDKDKKEGFATLESIVTDQGNGMSYCSACNTAIDIQKFTPPCTCPNCGRRLEWGSDGFVNFGGSDF